ncbi:MAG: helix-turn-helix domain-containing protein [Tepidisphaeraceae bacterium]
MASQLPSQLPRTFEELNLLHPLRPITDEVDLQNAEELMDRLAVMNKRTKDQNDYLATLVLLTEAFQKQEIDDAMDRSKSTGLDALKYLMGARGMRQTELARLLKISASAASMILAGDRPITASHARNLGKYFSLSPAAFI